MMLPKHHPPASSLSEHMQVIAHLSEAADTHALADFHRFDMSSSFESVRVDPSLWKHIPSSGRHGFRH